MRREDNQEDSINKAVPSSPTRPGDSTMLYRERSKIRGAKNSILPVVTPPVAPTRRSLRWRASAGSRHRNEKKAYVNYNRHDSVGNAREGRAFLVLVRVGIVSAARGQRASAKK